MKKAIQKIYIFGEGGKIDYFRDQLNEFIH